LGTPSVKKSRVEESNCGFGIAGCGSWSRARNHYNRQPASTSQKLSERLDIRQSTLENGSMRTFILFILLLTVACGASQQTTSTKPLTLTSADLSKLRWIEGSWKGTGDIDKPFYERYRFESDSVLVVEGYDDETFSKPTDTSLFELKEGHFGSADESAKSAAIAFDENSITFNRTAKNSSTFQWKRESPDLWTAIIKWQANDGTAKQRIYKMERVPGK
jgi:hypothetical protein